MMKHALSFFKKVSDVLKMQANVVDLVGKLNHFSHVLKHAKTL